MRNGTGPFGGRYSNLLADYLTRLNSQKYGDPTNLDKARHYGPPSLIFQGGRTPTRLVVPFPAQPAQVRELTVLRMPLQHERGGGEGAGQFTSRRLTNWNNPKENLRVPLLQAAAAQRPW